MNPLKRLGTARCILLASLALVWTNYALTARRAGVPGALHGARQPFFLALLVAATIAAAWPRWPAAPRPGWVAPACFAAGMSLLTVSFFQWFPLQTWTKLPYLDNWPTRFQCTVEGLQLYLRGVGVGWRWSFLGGYHTSSDISQSITTIAAVPMLLTGDRVGFHLVHLVVLLLMPLLIYVDVTLDRDEAKTARFAAGLVAVTVAGWFSFFMTRSGDTNSMAGTFCTVAALTGSHAAAVDRRWGASLLVGAMALLAYSHAAFFVFASLLLAVESLYYRDVRRLGRAAVAVVVGLVAVLPLTWESWRYSQYFTISNVDYPPPPFRLFAFLRQVGYNAQLMFLPGRWMNDFTGFCRAMMPAILFVAWKQRGRTGYYAWASLTTWVLLFMNAPVFGYAFMRPIHLLAVFPAAAVAGFFVRLALPRPVLALFAALSVAYVQLSWVPVPHINETRDLDPGLVDRIRSLDGAMVLLENTFHRDMAGGAPRSEKTPFDAHLEAYLVPTTGKRFYAGYWDGWQWSSFRTNLLSGGAFKGRMLSSVAPEQVTAELRKWGVRHLLVWSRTSMEFFSRHPQFARRWAHGLWTEFEFLDADPRDVVVANGSGRLTDLDMLGATVRLGGVRTGDLVVVRTNYFPAWTIHAGGRPIDAFGHDGQLAFRAPSDGSYAVTLEYPKRYGLDVLPPVMVLAGIAGCAWFLPGRRRPSGAKAPPRAVLP